MAIKVRDVVQLKPGGPKMSVTSMDANIGVACQWFAGSKMERGMFRPETLVPVTSEETGQPKK